MRTSCSWKRRNAPSNNSGPVERLPHVDSISTSAAGTTRDVSAEKRRLASSDTGDRHPRGLLAFAILARRVQKPAHTHKCTSARTFDDVG